MDDDEVLVTAVMLDDDVESAQRNESAENEAAIDRLIPGFSQLSVMFYKLNLF